MRGRVAAFLNAAIDDGAERWCSILIISASRRTDIPAFYSEWFRHRLQAGFVDVVNPFNRRQVSRLSLQPADVDCLVFWTKDAAPLLPYLDELAESYRFYFQFTLTPYDKEVEPGLRPKAAIIRTFQELSRRLGRERVVWRYDPIWLNDRYTIEYHQTCFARLLQQLAPYTDTCVISFLDVYRKTERNMRSLRRQTMTAADKREIAASLAQLAAGSGIRLQSCSEGIDLSAYGIQHGACIERERIEKICSMRLAAGKDKNQRPACGCASSVDIGQYDTCRHLCRYCYANTDAARVSASCAQHDPQSSILSGHLRGDEKITWRREKPMLEKPGDRCQPLSLF